MSRLILPESMDSPSIPEWFVRGLREMDKGLVIYWNRMIQRFVVDRCTNPDYHTHTPFCPRSNVLIVEDEQREYMSPCQNVLDRIKAMDAWSNFGTLERFRRNHEIAKEEHDQKMREEARQGYREAAADDRVQLNRAAMLIERHDIARVNQ